MKKFKFKSQLSFLFAGLLSVVIVSCEREFSDEIALATYPDIPEVFTDVPVSLTDQFFVSFDPAGGANVNGFGTDTKEAYLGTTSIRIDVPASNDPQGFYIGGIFVDRGNGRNLTNYDALTFWAKGSVTAEIGLFGFGTDFEGDAHAVGLNNVMLSTDWRKYTIPIPDASKLVQEKGVFAFAAGTANTSGLGYTFWMDEIRFVNSGIVAQPSTAISWEGGNNQTAYTGGVIKTAGIAQTVTLGDGSVVKTAIAPGYLDFKTSDPFVAQVNEAGEITVVGTSGTATITASFKGVDVDGSLIINSLGRFTLPEAPVPTHAAADVISIFSDAYPDAVTSNFTPGYGGSTTITTTLSNGVDKFLRYKSNNYTGIEFQATPIDASSKTHMHVDIYVEEAGTSSVEFQIRDIGENGEINTDVNTGNPTEDDKDYRFTANGLTVGEWKSFEIPLAEDLANQKNNLGSIVVVRGPDFILDNIYFY
ncbi:MAG: glycosyl hydrolase family 16 [Bacteroidetes bacterium]|nr:glycosyl hydrolase family 16 [Bacteroidota bacterium]